MDDAVVVRRLVSDVLAADPALDVVGTAANGRIALAKIPLLRPDLVVLDVEMPDMDGLATLAVLRQRHPPLPVIMFSTLTERGAATTLEALAAGAHDYVTKPTAAGGRQGAMAHIRQTLVPRVKALCRLSDPPALRSRRAAATPPGRRGAAGPRAGAGPRRVDVVAVGVSTGGPNALSVLLQALTRDFPVPIVVAQHMPATFTRLLAKRLDSQTALPVAEAVPGEVLRPGHVWVAPGGRHLLVRREGTMVRLVVDDGRR